MPQQVAATQELQQIFRRSLWSNSPIAWMIGATPANSQGKAGARRRKTKMSTRLQKATLPAAMVLLAIAGAARAQDNGCTNSTLRGDYAFTVSGQILNSDGTTTTRRGVALTHFDGSGNL